MTKVINKGYIFDLIQTILKVKIKSGHHTIGGICSSNMLYVGVAPDPITIEKGTHLRLNLNIDVAITYCVS